ncbi:unnamed protein product [Dovyalis caffra]|uniref:Uncharacterized protein n=1 Tax=Dovyalis caffra TaxID=77055 RepID=A0AAV1QP04_9ROSI|nr:unnamed protein product [Dovyalis caffra]
MPYTMLRQQTNSYQCPMKSPTFSGLCRHTQEYPNVGGEIERHENHTMKTRSKQPERIHLISHNPEYQHDTKHILPCSVRNITPSTHTNTATVTYLKLSNTIYPKLATNP